MTACILVGILWLSSVEATVDVRVRRTPVRTDGPVEISAHPSGGVQIPGRVLHLPIRKTQEFDVKGVAETALSATPATPATPASSTTTLIPPPAATSTSASSTLPAGSVTSYVKGRLEIVNNYAKPQTLVERTRFLSEDGKLFRLNQRVTVPAGGRATVDVTADQPGAAYAIGPAKFTIPGLWIDLQKLIFGESSTAFSARTDGSAPATPVEPAPSAPTPAVPSSTAPRGERLIVSQQNIDEAYQTLTDQVVEQAKRTLAASVTDARFNGAAYFVNTTSKSSTVRPGQAAASFIAQVDIEVIGVFYSSEDMQNLIRARLRERLPEGQEFLPFNEQDFIYTLESVDKEGENARLRVIANAEYRLTANTPALASAALAGKSKDEAARQLKAVEGVDAVEITLSPGWIGKIPRLTDHIKMEVK